MVRAGWSAQQAWEAIQKAHPHAMDHARADRRRWVQWVWNRAVLDDADYQPPRSPPDSTHGGRGGPGADPAPHDRLELAPTPPACVVLLVGHALLDRMARTGLLRVPCPERDLVLDTGVSDRKTIRAALRLLDGGAGELHRCFDPKDREASSFEFEVAPSTAEGTGVQQIPHLVVTPPSPPHSHPAPPTPAATSSALYGPLSTRPPWLR